MREWGHLKDFCFCDFRNAIVVSLYAQLYHPSIKTTILLIKLTCQDEMFAKFGQCTIMGLSSNALFDENCMHDMIAGIIVAIGRKTPTLL